jgi:hypothetical protein
MPARAATVAVTLLAALAGGCAGPAAGPAGPAPGPASGSAPGPSSGAVPGPQRGGPAAPVVHDRWESCDEAAPVPADGGFGVSQEALTLPLLGGDFGPVAAVVCRAGPRERPGGGTEIVAEEVRAADLTALLPALRLPDEAATAEACTQELPAVPWLALLDGAGRWIRPGIPVDACGKPRPEFRAAFDRLATTPVRSRVIR